MGKGGEGYTYTQARMLGAGAPCSVSRRGRARAVPCLSIPQPLYANTDAPPALSRALIMRAQPLSLPVVSLILGSRGSSSGEPDGISSLQPAPRERDRAVCLCRGRRPAAAGRLGHQALPLPGAATSPRGRGLY